MHTESGDRRPHLLIIDDDRLILSTLSIGLERAGYRVSTSDSAEEAEALVAQGMRPDLALVDIRMTGRDGIYLAEKFREHDQISPS